MKNLIFTLMFLSISTTTYTQENNFNKDSDTIPLNPTVEYGELKNGFTYYLAPNPHAKGRIKLNLIIKSGNWHEDKDQRGYAHLLEHMGFKGTKNFPNGNDYFTQRGAYPHAKTRHTYTLYEISLPPSKQKNLVKDGLNYMRDLTNNLTLEQSSIDVERGAVLGEGRNINPHMWWQNQIILRNQSIKNTNYENKLFDNYNPDYKDEQIRNFNRKSFIRFYREHYTADNQGIVVVGDFNPDSLKVWVRNIFSDLKSHKKNRSRQKDFIEPIYFSGNNQYDKVVDTINPNFRVIINSKSVAFGNHNKVNKSDYKDVLVQDLYNTLILQRAKVINNSYDSPISSLVLIEELLLESIRFTVKFDSYKSDYIQNRFMDALVLWKKLHTEFTPSEIEAAKTFILSKYANQSQDNFHQSIRYINHFVSDVAVPGIENEIQIVTEILNDIELKEIQSYADDKMDLGSNKDFMFFNESTDQVPDFDTIKKWVKRVDSSTVTSLVPLKPITTFKNNFTPPFNNKNIKLSSNEIGIARVRLPNNISIILKPTAPSSEGFSNSVNILAYLSPGLPYKSDNQQYLASTIAPDAIQFSGAGEFTKFEIDDFMREKDMRMLFRTDAFSQNISGSAKAEDLEEWFALLNLYIKQPRKDHIAFEAWKKTKQQIIDGTWGRNSSNFYKDSVKVRQYPNLPSYTSIDLQKLTMEEVYHAFQERFSSIKDYTFIVTGDFNTKELAPKIIRYISGLPATSKKPSQAVDKPEFHLEKKNERIEFPNFNQVSVQLSFPFLANSTLKSKIIYKIISKALTEMIYDRLRKGCYFPRAYGNWVDTSNGIFAFNIAFDSELGHEEILINNALEEFRDLRKNGVDQKWLKTTIENERRVYAQRIETSGYSSFWEDYIKMKLETGENLTTDVLQYEAMLTHFITVEDVNNTAKKYMSEDNLQQFLIIPENYDKTNLGSKL